MMQRSTTCSRCSHAAGLTLIEVVAAIAILGTLLVGIVLARARHTHQYARAESARVAVDAADRLISRWWLNGRHVPVGKAGQFEAHPTLRWRTREVDNEKINLLGARVVRVEVLRADAETGSDPQARAEVLFHVDLVMPRPESERQPAESVWERQP